MVISAKSSLLICLSSYGWYSSASTVLAQIIPDRSLGSENSLVTPKATVKEGAISDYLEGGAVRGKNLFHSFSEFNVDELQQVYFASPSGIEQIFTRVTGANPSQIRGTLGVDGGANLFLLNPNGVIFGSNSQLDIAGSLLTTTADSYIFNNGFEFSATNPEIPPLLTLDIPIGLQFGSAPGQIINRSGALIVGDRTESSSSESVLDRPEGLSINASQNLSFLGGEISIEGGYFNTDGGKIELGAVAANNRIKLAKDGQHWQVDYSEIGEFADLKFNRGGGIDGGQTGGTQISLRGKDISLGYSLAELEEYSLEDFFSLEEIPALDALPGDWIEIFAQNQDSQTPAQIDIQAARTFSIIDPGKTQQNLVAHTSGSGDGGQINVTAEQIVLYGASLESWTLAGATGDAGSIDFTANDMTIQHGGGGVNTFSRGNGGTIDLNLARDLKIQYGGFGIEASASGNGGRISINAENLDIRFGGIGVGTFAEGNGGKIDLNIAQTLNVFAGGFGADAFDEGNGGSIEINALDIELIDAGMGANTTGNGQGGKISLSAKNISFKNGIIGAESGQDVFDERNIDERGIRELFERDAGDGGNIFVRAETLMVDNGNITTSSFGKGNAGDIELKVGSLEASGMVDLDSIAGINSSTDGVGRGGKITLIGDRLKLRDGATIAANSTDIGQAGNIEIEVSDRVQLEDRGTISVDGGATGLPGEIVIQSPNLLLNREGKISATTNQGTQGNIRLMGEQMFMTDGSQIVTNAGKDATGGNIFIDLQYNLLGLDNSRITASAEQGQGGNINISTRGIFFSADSKINASSQFGIDGLIRVDTLDIAPNADLIQLPAKPIDPNLYLSRGCSTNNGSQFISAGKGGLPENPLNSISQAETIADLDPLVSQSQPNLEALESNLPQAKPLVEAQTWKINQSGKTELVAVSDRTLKHNQIDCLK